MAERKIPRGYRRMAMEPDGVYYARRRAAKDYPCDITPGCTIHKGEEYIDLVTAPWTMVVEDVNDDGQPTGYPLGHWERRRYHEYKAFYGPGPDYYLHDQGYTCPSRVGTKIGEKPARPSSSDRPERERNPAAYPESQRMGGGDPLADYLWAKGEL